MENCTLGGDIEDISGLYIAEGAEVGGAETLLDLFDGNCFPGDEIGEDTEGVLDLLNNAGLLTISSSGTGPRFEPTLVELNPDIAEVEILSSFCVGPFEFINEF